MKRAENIFQGGNKSVRGGGRTKNFGDGGRQHNTNFSRIIDILTELLVTNYGPLWMSCREM